jgi:hypothetical protein
MRANYGEPLRCWLRQQHIEEIIDFGDLPVFQKATTYPCIVVIRKDSPSSTFSVTEVKTLGFSSLDNYVRENHYAMRITNLDDKGWSLIEKEKLQLLDRLRSESMCMSAYVKGTIYRGVLTGLDEAFVIDSETKERLIAEDRKSSELIKPYLMGRDIKRYQPPGGNRYLIFTRRGIDIQKYPAIERYLKQYKEKLMPRPKNWKGANWNGRKPGSYQWYEIQDTVDYHKEFENPKIMYLKFQVKPAFVFDDAGFYPNSAIWIISKYDPYLLGILNSKLGWFLISNCCTQIQNGYQLIFKYLGQLPIHTINFSNTLERSRHDKMVELVERMLALYRQLAAAKTDHEKSSLRRQIEATDNQIDRMVYELYGLTEEEIKIIEQGS